jgi:hypothetical protein
MEDGTINNHSYRSLCLYHVVDGLCAGLSQFSGQSRAALIYAEGPGDPVRIYDPQDLLRGHEPRLRELYLDSSAWRRRGPDTSTMTGFGEMHPEKNLELTGLVSYGGRSRSIFYQMWFTEHHPDMCSIGPTERWLEHAAFLLANDFAFENALYAGSSGYVLREYATHAVRDYILDEINVMLGWDTKVLVLPILDAVLAISKTPEEGHKPRGHLVFVAPDGFPDLAFLIRFPRDLRPGIQNHKHVRKLLQAVERADRKLVSDGLCIVGIAAGRMPDCRLTADFRGSHGFLRFAGEPVCSFSDGRFTSSNRKANLVDLEEMLFESSLDPEAGGALFRLVKKIVNHAGEEKFGCTIVIDPNERPLSISGQTLDRPVNLENADSLDLACSLAKVDGALHIGPDLKLHAFGCLLDGQAVPGENLSRGARFNSALRFTSERREVIVVVVSSDRPVSIIQGGVEITARCELKAFSKLVSLPPTLEEWTQG